MCSRVAGASAGRLHLVGAWPAAFTLLVDGLQVNLVAVHLQGLGESVVWRIFVAWKSQASGSPFFFSILGATTTFRIDEKIALLGSIQSLFEGSMYTFVFLWTLALSPNEEENSSWLFFCIIRAIINVGALYCIMSDGPFCQS
uniref:Uncharacterized protein n=1 Tax=Opuntia streptacantha TaxID=393608 RepID=A0A7C8ZJN0_OPUST